MAQITTDFSEKVVLVTGAGHGVGRALAESFASQGAAVAANDINPLSLDETLARIATEGGKARDYAFDVAKRMPVQAMVNQILEDWGRIDILINCAAVEPAESVLDMDEWDWHRTIDVNLGGSFFTMQQVGRAMRQQGGGVITNLAGRISQDQLPKKNQAAYLASQMGLVGLTLEAAKELSVYNIRVNVVCLGMCDIISFPADPVLEEVQRRNRPELFERILGMVLYLCGPTAGSLTGQVVNLGSQSVV